MCIERNCHVLFRPGKELQLTRNRQMQRHSNLSCQIVLHLALSATVGLVHSQLTRPLRGSPTTSRSTNDPVSLRHSPHCHEQTEKQTSCRAS